MTLQARASEASLFTKRDQYTYAELTDCANGSWEGKPKLPTGDMLVIDSITSITANGGAFDKGLVLADFAINEDRWFFPQHFVDDPVMPGCLQLDALWQLLGFFIGWSGASGKGRARKVGGVEFLGEILPTAKLVVYRIDIKRLRVSDKGPSFGFADGSVTCDGKLACVAHDLNVMIIPAGK